VPLQQKTAFLEELRLDFNDQVIQLATTMPATLEQLQRLTEYEENVNALFRTVHSLKPLAGYLGLSTPQRLFEQCESVLSILRSQKSAPSLGRHIEWLELVSDQLSHWKEEMESGSDAFSAVDPRIGERLQIRRADRHPREVLKPLSLLVVTTNPSVLANATKGVAPYFKRFYTASGLEEAKQTYFEHYPDIVFCDYRLDGGHTGLDLYRSISHDDAPLPFLMLTGSGYREEFRKIAHYGIPSLPRPLSLQKLLYELIDMGQLYFGNQRIRMHSEGIKRQIEQIQPLPESIREVIRLCDDEEAPLKELLGAVQRDPVLSALVVKEANSPLYNQRIQSVDRAVSFFGKRVVKALSLSLSTELITPMELDCYRITPEQFKKVSNMRLALMMAWYAKVNARDLGILASTAVISNLGQIILGRELQAQGVCHALQSLVYEHTICDAEEHVMGTTTPEVTADILKQWKFDPLTVDAIRYTYSPDHAPREARRLALANHIVCRLIPANTTELPTGVPDDVAELMEREGLDVEVLGRALEKLAG
jgi:HD-like signal output (HDOD) protein/HPt (histidine-containing phosphotransfer) domain-containing protein